MFHPAIGISSRDTLQADRVACKGSGHTSVLGKTLYFA